MAQKRNTLLPTASFQSPLTIFPVLATMTSRAALKSLDALKIWFSGSKQRMKKLARGNGTPGERAGPTQSGNNDSKIGSRLDVGEILQKDGKNFRRYFWQFNIDAENSTIRKAAQKDRHRKISYADVEMKENPTDEESNAILDTVFKTLADNAKE
ncbi:hypothetical protein LOZ12_005311 [Ophidiomyces ophidiicola]|nr:hypothetical protein LOZ62_005798 [Ophidiomyces ophidiicola]KAI1953229.1 hypothetical protein LOZ59_005206 [Ophidiomyces ophidiicola]KAI1968548.1 hypothetical protein LOZ56_005044 [Ophidiomyces ophidiicola]KAI2031593.1 hypothetical protein LOZ48_002718 [Ophidiomyces ophidiicola]KAI2034249.1 hypothetical protein LOZ47_005123 [Ophidiomyces ophidiicola]